VPSKSGNQGKQFAAFGGPEKREGVTELCPGQHVQEKRRGKKSAKLNQRDVQKKKKTGTRWERAQRQGRARQGNMWRVLKKKIEIHLHYLKKQRGVEVRIHWAQIRGKVQGTGKSNRRRGERSVKKRYITCPMQVHQKGGEIRMKTRELNK